MIDTSILWDIREILMTQESEVKGAYCHSLAVAPRCFCTASNSPRTSIGLGR